MYISDIDAYRYSIKNRFVKIRYSNSPSIAESIRLKWRAFPTPSLKLSIKSLWIGAKILSII